MFFGMVHVVRKPDFMHANNKGEDQTAQMRHLVFPFVIHVLESLIAKLTVDSKINENLC